MALSKQIDDALGRYYAQLERTDYYGEGGQNADGLFLKWFRDNGYDDDAIEEELGETADFEECAFTDFTDDFPLNKDHQFGEEPTNLQIFRILQHCYLRPTQYGFDPLAQRSPTKLFPSSYLSSELGTSKREIIFLSGNFWKIQNTKYYFSFSVRKELDII